jgi:prephenate dehydrogenase
MTQIVCIGPATVAAKGEIVKIAFFGVGLMGAGFVRHALQNGHQVDVWNRDV